MWVKDLLTMATEKIPPEKDQRHSITLMDDEVELCLMQGDRYYPFRLEPGDNEKPVDQLITEIKIAMQDVELTL